MLVPWEQARVSRAERRADAKRRREAIHGTVAPIGLEGPEAFDPGLTDRFLRPRPDPVPDTGRPVPSPLLQPVGDDRLAMRDAGRQPVMVLPDSEWVERDLLTDDEHEFVEQLGRAWNLLCDVVGSGSSRSGDLAEAATHVHALQNLVLAQAAARAYPDRYRLLGLEIVRDVEVGE